MPQVELPDLERKAVEEIPQSSLGAPRLGVARTRRAGVLGAAPGAPATPAAPAAVAAPAVVADHWSVPATAGAATADDGVVDAGGDRADAEDVLATVAGVRPKDRSGAAALRGFVGGPFPNLGSVGQGCRPSPGERAATRSVERAFTRAPLANLRRRARTGGTGRTSTDGVRSENAGRAARSED